MKIKVLERVLQIFIFVLCVVRLLLEFQLRAIDLTIETADTYLFWHDVILDVRLILIILLPVLWLVTDKRKRTEEQAKTREQINKAAEEN